MSDYGPVADMAEELRDALLVAFVTAESNGGPAAPSRVFVTEGLPVAEGCDQCPVYVEGVGVSLADGTNAGTLDRARVTTVRVDLAAQAMRCAAPMDEQGNVTVADLESSARVVYSDMIVMLRAVLEGTAAQTLFGACQRVMVREVVGIEAQGGIVGSVMRLSVTL